MKKIVYVDMDDTLADMESALRHAKAKNPDMPFPQAEYGFFANLTPLEGAIESIQWLLNSKRYNPYILTAPSVMNPMSYTEKRYWVEKHLGMEMAFRLVISPDKSLLNGDYLIDDKVKRHGQEKFKGELIQY